MKKRLLIITISLIAMLLIFIISFFGNLNQRRITLAIELIFITFLLIYMFGGIPKLVSSIIYGIGLASLLVLMPAYDVALILIGTFIVALNPLADLENKIQKRFPEEETILSQIRGTYNAYYEYRKEIKNYYHLPQMKKIYTKPSYMKLRQGLTIILAMLAVFLLIREVNNLINLLKYFQIHQFFASTYSVIILATVTVILYRKGFQSTLNFLTASIFPPAAYTLYVIVKPATLGIVFGSMLLVIGIFVIVYQYINYRSRIVYEYYYYYDNNKQAEVYANALFEPFVYDEAFRLVTTFKIKTNITSFNKVFHNITVYADIHRFFITAYTYNRNEVIIYTDFHYTAEKRIEKFSTYLESLFENSVTHNVYVDPEKALFEKEFFHNNDYIVARAIYLAELLKKLEIKSSVIVSMVAYFSNMDDVNKMSEKFNVTRLPSLDMEEILTARIDMKVNNVDYIIENKMRDMLLELLINRGTYVRISVYY